MSLSEIVVSPSYPDKQDWQENRTSLRLRIRAVRLHGTLSPFARARSISAPMANPGSPPKPADPLLSLLLRDVDSRTYAAACAALSAATTAAVSKCSWNATTIPLRTVNTCTQSSSRTTPVDRARAVSLPRTTTRSP